VSSFLGLPKTFLHLNSGYLRVSKLEKDYQNSSLRTFKSLRRGNRAFTGCSRKRIALRRPDRKTDELSETYFGGVSSHDQMLCLRTAFIFLCMFQGWVYVNGWLLDRQSRMKAWNGNGSIGSMGWLHCMGR
jgi:hypothetical protein